MMQNLQDIQEKIFFESKNILDTLSKINSWEELLSKQDLFSEVADRIAFLRILEKNKGNFVQLAENAENLYSEGNAAKSEVNLSDISSDENRIEEEVMFTTEINEIDNSENSVNQLSPETENPLIESYHPEMVNRDNAEFQEARHDFESLSQHENPSSEPVIPLAVEQEDAEYAERISQKEKDFLESEEKRRKIVEFGKTETAPTLTDSLSEEKIAEISHDRKFKLANIKGLKAVQNLFDDDPLENVEEKNAESDAQASGKGSLLKSNIPTDFMEAPKKQHEFKLDFNDRIAFSKHLFNGDDANLKSTIERLNSYHNIEEARQDLSEVYYQKNWSKVDEYAQRLWNLVENKFL